MLPPANEVWGKVKFSQAFVCPRGSASGSRGCLPLDQGGCLPLGLGVYASGSRGCTSWSGVCAHSHGHTPWTYPYWTHTHPGMRTHPWTHPSTHSPGHTHKHTHTWTHLAGHPTPHTHTHPGHPQVSKRAVRILLECYLVSILES